MLSNKESYDYIISLGGNCTVAHNLRFRNMRPFSLPLDWVYIEDEKPILWLAKAFKNNFADFCLKENLQLQPATPEHEVIYFDKASGYYLPNQFTRIFTDTNGEYEKFYAKLQTRIKRLYSAIQNSKRVLFILATTKKINPSCVAELQKELNQLFPDVEMDFRVMLFASTQETVSEINPHLVIYQYLRTTNLYDFNRSNFEWSFMDNIKLTHKAKKNKLKLLSVHLFKHRFSLELSWKNYNE